MLSVVLGIATALQWGLGAVVLRPAAREIAPGAFAFWFAAYTSLLVAVPAAVLVAGRGLDAGDAGVAVVAGLGQAAGSSAYSRALAKGDLITVGPLVSLEGAFAAVLGIAAGVAVGPLVAAGLLLCVAGGLAVGAPADLDLHAPGAAWAVAAGAAYGLVLFTVGRSHADIVVLTFLLNAVAALVIGAARRSEVLPRGVSPRSHGWLLLASALNVGGLVSFAVGARQGSLAVTAVLAAQIGLVAVAGGYLLHGERLTWRQGGGCLALSAGVAILAAG